MGSRLEANSSSVRKRIEKHKFDNEEGEEYESSKFGGFRDYFRRKRIKLQNLDAELRSAGNHPAIFRGVVAHVNGYTQPSLNDLHTLIVRYGGGFMQYLDGKTTVTHIIASNLTPKKKVEFSRYRIVKPAWVVESIKAGKLLPWDAYRVVDEGVGQRVLGFNNGNIISQANSSYGGYREQMDTSWYAEQLKDIAGKINARDPELPCPGNQVPVNDEIESGIEVEISRRRSRETNVKEASTPTFRQPMPQDCDDNPIITSHQVDLELYESVPEYPDTHSDFDHAPAADESFTESQSNTQEKHAPHTLVQMVEQIVVRQPEPSPVLGASLPEQLPAQSPLANKGSYLKELSQSSLARKETNTGNLHEDLATEDYENPSGASPESSSDPSLEPFRLINGNNQAAGAVGGVSEITPEEHNALLLADPKVWKSTVVNPGFLKQYYEESRLHHLSTWKAALKTQLQALAAEKSSSQKTREKRIPGARRYILHVDFDCFFAAVSIKRHPEYIYKPVVVAHGSGSGAEIASCNYPARKFGIKNGMWMKHALKMCPDLKVLPYDFKAYEEASREFYGAIMDTGGIVQSVSVDEALVDVSAQCNAAGGHDGNEIHEDSILREQAKAEDIGTGLREKVKEKTGCAVSVGIGGNILLAKVALRKAKPAGQYHVKPEDALDFLGGLTMQDLPGIAYSIGGKLEEIGVKHVKDVRQLSKERMIAVLGPKTGEKVWDYSRGIDRAEVGDQVIRKSVSAEVNWGIRFVTQEQADEFVQSLCDELHNRLVTEGVKGRQLTMKIMRRAADAPLDPPKHLGHGKCDTFNKSIVLGVATNDAEVLGREAVSIMRGWGFSPGELRGIGCQMQKLEPLKGAVDSLQDGSQKRLQFKTSGVRKPPLPRDDSVVDEIDSPQKPKVPPPPHPAAAFAKDPSPSRKPRMPLNTLGTQFVIPSQIDPEVLAELPSDIRSKLLSSKEPRQNIEKPNPDRSRSGTPNLAPDIPLSHSQIDQEALEALPSDVRAEILAYYHIPPQKSHNQAVLPQSPRKGRSIKLPKKLTTPTKRRAGLLSRGGNKQSTSTLSTLTQSNFVANARGSTSKSTSITDELPLNEIPPDFLSALPDTVRLEVLAQARHDRLQKHGGIDFTSNKQKPSNASAQALTGQLTLALPPRPPKPTFTAQKLSTLPELREAMGAWFEEFKAEGPYSEDVDALVKYLRRVVGEEGDMGKAVSVVSWLRWVIDHGGGGNSWGAAVGRVEEGVQEAVGERGLGRVAIQ